MKKKINKSHDLYGNVVILNDDFEVIKTIFIKDRSSKPATGKFYEGVLVLV